MKIAVVILCAGSGTRMKMETSKLLIDLAGKTVLERSVMAFHNIQDITQKIVVCRQCDRKKFKSVLSKYDVDFVVGGETRQQSTLNALSVIENADFIAIHDGARPLVTKEGIVSTIDGAVKFGASAIGVPVKDTIKRIDAKSLIVETVDRNQLFSIQTPQIFNFANYKKAFESARKNGFDFTDDCQLLESFGMDVFAVKGDYNNIKITTQEDIQLALSILKSRGELA